MKRKLMLIAGAVSLWALNSAVAAVDSSAPKSAATEISITDYKFIPETLNVPVGAQVTWVNHDQIPHTIVDEGKQFRSGALDTDNAYAHVYRAPGTYRYFCSLHPQMIGTIVVSSTASP
jgi:plastocyanin